MVKDLFSEQVIQPILKTIGQRQSNTMLFSTFIICEVRATGQKSLRPNGVDFLVIGTRQEAFQSKGTIVRLRLRLKRCWEIIASWLSQVLKTRGLMPSGPAAFCWLSLLSCLFT